MEWNGIENALESLHRKVSHLKTLVAYAEQA